MARTTDPDVRLLAAAADPTRLAILRQLADETQVCACDFESCCDVSQPTMSHHLRVLREAGWILGERRGSWVYYRLTPNALERLGRLVGSLTPAGSLPESGRAGLRLPVLAS
jgi:ArsR family transcriptional regulator, arsenate/arsenite/antimonite-responsive transcriptional repressor